jgi:hypothetical protein
MAASYTGRRRGRNRESLFRSFEVLEERRLLANVPPDLGPIANQTATPGDELVVDLSASDADGPVGDLHVFLDPDETPAVGAVVDPAEREFRWTPTAAQAGTFRFIVLVTDRGMPALADAEVFTVTVVDATANLPPDLADIADRTVDENSPLTFTVTATDANAGSVLTYSLDADGLPSGATINPTTGQFSWTPSEAQGPGTFTLRVLATDNGTPALADSETFTVTVNEVNSAPTLAAIGNRTGTVGQPIAFTA